MNVILRCNTTRPSAAGRPRSKVPNINNFVARVQLVAVESKQIPEKNIFKIKKAMLAHDWLVGFLEAFTGGSGGFKIKTKPLTMIGCNPRIGGLYLPRG